MNDEQTIELQALQLKRLRAQVDGLVDEVRRLQHRLDAKTKAEVNCHPEEEA